MALAPKHTAAATNIFTFMSSLAQQENAYNLSQGLPDYPVDLTLSNLLKEAVDKGFNQYAPMPGLGMLRENIAASYNARYPTAACHPDLVTITPGATYAIYIALATVIEKGDEVICIEPAFDCYIPAIEMNGGIPVLLQLDEQNDFALDFDKLASLISAKTRAILINTPHNPTGKCWTQADWDKLAHIVDGKNVYIISDEVYDSIVFYGTAHLPGFLQQQLADKIISIYSFGKMFHITGWKVGYCITSQALTAAIRSMHQYMCFSVNSPAQYALAKYLEEVDSKEAATLLQSKKELLINGMQHSRFITTNSSMGTYFQLYDYSAISDMPDVAFAEWLTLHHKVATIPLSAFYKSPVNRKIVRLCFAKKDEVIIAATKILAGL